MLDPREPAPDAPESDLPPGAMGSIVIAVSAALIGLVASTIVFLFPDTTPLAEVPVSDGQATISMEGLDTDRAIYPIKLYFADEASLHATGKSRNELARLVRTEAADGRRAFLPVQPPRSQGAYGPFVQLGGLEGISAPSATVRIRLDPSIDWPPGMRLAVDHNIFGDRSGDRSYRWHWYLLGGVVVIAFGGIGVLYLYARWRQRQMIRLVLRGERRFVDGRRERW